MASLSFMDKDKTKKIYDILIKVAADEGCLAGTSFIYSLNVEGPRAGMLECLFGKEGFKLMKVSAKACKHIRAIGCKIPTQKEMMASSRLTIDDKKDKTEDEMIQDLIDYHEKIIKYLCTDIDTMRDLKEPDCELFLTKTLNCQKKLLTCLKVLKEKKSAPKSA
mmetsp:Transcript_21804/g.30494  ORF Transcript_21804/g.30494 Transcript_21804/m.30494 type:complete len:164 (+) Transcript_21804:52-543(+)